MKSYKQLLADFYLALLALPNRSTIDTILLMTLSTALAVELNESPETVERIFERMAAEDKQPIKIVCCDCGEPWPNGVDHVCSKI